MTQNYSADGLSRLYQAIKQQAEQDLLMAIERNYPGILPDEKIRILSRYRHLERKAEQRLIEQSRGK